MVHMTIVHKEVGPVARVTFTLPSSIWADAICLVGDFNGWNRSSHPLAQDREGTWVLSVDLEPNRTYAFAYVCDGQWLTDDHADGWLWDADGQHAFLVITDVDRVRLPASSSHSSARLGAHNEEARMRAWSTS
jgi:hypothetical protein